jgi:nucleotide-binding universal stress UspA family protein
VPGGGTADDPTMGKTIIIPLDGSELAEGALEPAEWLAEALDADLLLVTATPALDHAPEQALLARALSRTTRPGARREVLVGSHPGRTVLERAQALTDAVICMSTRGQGALATALIGSVAMELLSHSDLPVVLVGPSFDRSTARRDGIVLCGHDSDEALRPGLGLECAVATGLPIHVLSVRHESSGGPQSPPSEAAEQAAIRLRAEGRPAVGHDLRAPDVASTIVGVARSLRPRLLVIERNPPARRIDRPLGRVGLELVRECPCPVVIEPASAARPTAAEPRLMANT